METLNFSSPIPDPWKHFIGGHLGDLAHAKIFRRR
jgi:hypothetical protein